MCLITVLFKVKCYLFSRHLFVCFLKDYDLVFLHIYIQCPVTAVLFQDVQVMLKTISGWRQQNEVICIKQVSDLCVSEACSCWSASSFIYRLNNVGLKQHPYFTPRPWVKHSVLWLLIFTAHWLCLHIHLIRSYKLPPFPLWRILKKSPSCQMESKAF